MSMLCFFTGLVPYPKHTFLVYVWHADISKVCSRWVVKVITATSGHIILSNDTFSGGAHVSVLMNIKFIVFIHC